jgi:arylsulfatase A-like enzyme
LGAVGVAALNFAFSKKSSEEAFVRTRVEQGWDNRRGLLLPAPAVAAFDLQVPPAAELTLAGGVVEPEVAEGAPSDGAELQVEVEVNGQVTSIGRAPLRVGDFDELRFDLSRFSGQAVRLRLRTLPGASARFDYVFLGDPLVGSRRQKPRRVVLVFMDTTRTDHLSLFGYERDTSLAIDRLADRAVLFSHARSVSPWTLPSARTVLTGRHPEYYFSTPTLGDRLREEGFATAMFAGNVYLSSNFGMDRGWGLHRVELWPSAEAVVDDALAWMEAREGQDVLVQVQFMDAHLPYCEPDAYRHLYAAEGPEALRDQFHLSDVRKAELKRPIDRQYVQDRYDNNVRYMTDQIGRLVQHLRRDDILVVFGDHGEEFWEHGGFEHGHSLYDELLRVPLVVQGPGLSNRVVQAPTSLLDITPTVLELLGLPAEGLDGVSLVGAAKGEEAALVALRERDLAFGRPLYGMERWGVLSQGRKWTTSEGREELYQLKQDPGEEQNLARRGRADGGDELRATFAKALGRPSQFVYRLVNVEAGKRAPDEEMKAVLRVPGGAAQAFLGDDPLETSAASVSVDPDEETVTVSWAAGHSGVREVYVVPLGALDEVTPGLALELSVGASRRELAVAEDRDPVPDQDRRPLMSAKLGDRGVQVTWAFVPLPDERATALVGADAELDEALKAMGYVEE